MEYDNDDNLMCMGKSITIKKKSFLPVPTISGAPRSPNTTRKNRNNSPRTPGLNALETREILTASNSESDTHLGKELENITLPPINLKETQTNSQLTWKKGKNTARVSKRKRKTALCDPELGSNEREIDSNSTRIGQRKQFKLKPLDREFARINDGKHQFN